MPLISRDDAIKLGLPREMLHTILFPMENFTRPQATKWIKEHKYDHKRVRNTRNFIRYNQSPEVKDAIFYTKKLPNGVELVFEKWF